MIPKLVTIYTYIYIHTYNKLFAINVSKYKCKCKFKTERRVCKAWFRVINKNRIRLICSLQTNLLLMKEL